jgi:hypothetical protein
VEWKPTYGESVSGPRFRGAWAIRKEVDPQGEIWEFKFIPLGINPPF